MLSRLSALIVLVVVAACTSSPPSPTASGPNASADGASQPVPEAAGPILSLNVGVDVDDEGNPVDPSFTFPADQEQIVVIAQLGQLDEPFVMAVAWYRLPDAWAAEGDAEKELFRHELEVGPGDSAWSMAVNDGASGSYLVRATVDDQTSEIVFDVHAAGGPADSTPTGPVATGDPDVQPELMAGDSGTVDARAEAADDCAGVVDAWRSEYAAGFIDVDAQYALSGPVVTDKWDLFLSFNRCTGGGANYITSAMQGRPPGPFETDPCLLPDGSDLPGATVVHTLQTRGPVQTSWPNTILLGDDTLAPRARVRSVPGPGTQVEEGDEIRVTALAEERRHGGPWQMGVQRIQLLSLRPSQELVDSVDFTGQRGRACDAKAWDGTLEATYTVPPDPPPFVELCVVAEDWAGNGEGRGEWKCAKFPTGEVWTGTIVEEFAPGGGQVVAEGKNVELVVGPDGAVKEGTWSLTFTRCTVPNCYLVGSTDSLTVSGNRDASGFHLKLTGPGGSVDLDIPVAGKTAKGTLPQAGGGSITIDLKCTSCE